LRLQQASSSYGATSSSEAPVAHTASSRSTAQAPGLETSEELLYCGTDSDVVAQGITGNNPNQPSQSTAATSSSHRAGDGVLDPMADNQGAPEVVAREAAVATPASAAAMEEAGNEVPTAGQEEAQPRVSVSLQSSRLVPGSKQSQGMAPPGHPDLTLLETEYNKASKLMRKTYKGCISQLKAHVVQLQSALDEALSMQQGTNCQDQAAAATGDVALLRQQIHTLRTQLETYQIKVTQLEREKGALSEELAGLKGQLKVYKEWAVAPGEHRPPSSGARRAVREVIQLTQPTLVQQELELDGRRVSALAAGAAAGAHHTGSPTRRFSVGSPVFQAAAAEPHGRRRSSPNGPGAPPQGRGHSLERERSGGSEGDDRHYRREEREDSKRQRRSREGDQHLQGRPRQWSGAEQHQEQPPNPFSITRQPSGPWRSGHQSGGRGNHRPSGGNGKPPSPSAGGAGRGDGGSKRKHT
jgi:hypothetical protein